MIAMREVETGHIHTRLDQSLELLDLPACWTKCTEDLGSSVALILSTMAFDGVEGDVTSSKKGDVGCVGDHGCCQ